MESVVRSAALLHTDQTLCFDENGNAIGCLDSGQDGASNSVRPAVRERFTVIDQIVEDQWTELTWPMRANLATFPLTWKEAFAFVREMNQAERFGRSDWRIPTRADLFSLVSHQCINPSLPANHPFTDAFSGYYWTSTQCARLPDQAWYIHMGGARVYRGMKHGSYMVWPVAGRIASAGSILNRFVATKDSFHDRLTLKTWLPNQWVNTAPLSWREALDQVRAANRENAAGHSDWRLPNIRELESLIDVTRHSPAFAWTCPLPAAPEGYWSSTTSVYNPSYAWVLYPQDGAVGVGYKPQRDFHFLAVR